ncbi:hypothetical protein FRC02_002439 [Tulasnella sp. 418]|nr:hypothetical protein FRC02_002439 [Tulasnella sp. 418]
MNDFEMMSTFQYSKETTVVPLAAASQNVRDAAVPRSDTKSGPPIVSTSVRKEGDGIEMTRIGSGTGAMPTTSRSNDLGSDGVANDETASTPTSSVLRKDRIYLAVLSWSLFVAGWSDGTLGPLLPRIQNHYHVGYTVVSLLFVTNCLCCILGALASSYLSDKLGFGKIAAGSAVIQVAAYAIKATAPPFPVLCVVYGITLGRVALLWVNQKIGEKRVVYLYAILAMGLELVVWLVPNVVGNAIAVSLIGVLMGPFYPICMNVAGSLLPQSILVGSIGWITGLGQAGAALFPFITGK